MRPAIHGSEVIFKEDSFVGVNLGYNFYAEHEGDIEKLVQQFNYKTCTNVKEISAYKKSLQEIGKKWKKSEFWNYILNPYTTTLVKRKITIDNSSKAPYYTKYLCYDEEYIALYFYNNSYPDSFASKLQSKKKFREDEFYCMRDFAQVVPEKSVLNNVLSFGRDGNITGSWTSYHPHMLLLIRKEDPKSLEIVASITNAYRTCNLGLAPVLDGVFADRGLILFDANKLEDSGR